MHMKGSSWDAAFEVLDYLEEAGCPAYIVGGAVRDALLDRKIRDIDVAAAAASETVKDLFPGAVQPSSSFPTFIVRWKKQTFEITCFRPDRFSLTSDLKHRDFTINAMALDQTGALQDPYGGRKDLNSRLLRFVINPVRRMEEDPVRTLRAFRFVSQYGFVLEEMTWDALCINNTGLAEAAEERIQSEMEKLLEGMNVSRAVDLMFKAGIPDHFPVPLRPVLDRAEKKNPCMDQLITIEERWAACFYLLYNGEAAKYVKKWPMSKNRGRTIRNIIDIIASCPSEINWNSRLVYQNGRNHALQIERVHQWLTGKQNSSRLEWVMDIDESLPIRSRSELHVNGSDIVHLYPDLRGETIGSLLRELEDEVIDGRAANHRSKLLSLIKEKLSDER
ncbi:hypothetical protein [Salibacterium sp. K-3]